MKELLEKISELAYELGEADFPDHNLKWLGEEPCTQEQISELEERLKIQLPKDYVDFLKITNGFEAAIDTEPYFLYPELVCYLRDYDPELIDIWKETGNEEIAADLKTSILVGGRDDEQQFLLLPPKDGHPEWRYWKFAHWIPGEEEYDSLENYFQYVSDFLQDISEDKETELQAKLTAEEKKELSTLRSHIDSIMIEYGDQYTKLEEESFELFLKRKALEQKYGALDKITGLTGLFERLAQLEERNDDEEE